MRGFTRSTDGHADAGCSREPRLGQQDREWLTLYPRSRASQDHARVLNREGQEPIFLSINDPSVSKAR